MRLTVLALLVGGLAAASAGAQETPAGHVAALARRAMAEPGEATAWSELAKALPDLAIQGGAGLEETFEAARIADSLAAACAPPSPPVPVLPVGKPDVREGVAEADAGGAAEPAPPGGGANQILVAATVAAAGALVGMGWLRMRRQTRTSAPIRPGPSRRRGAPRFDGTRRGPGRSRIGREGAALAARLGRPHPGRAA
ncbi:MAG TPA: hypothetical protein VLH75_16730 [Longimicrobiales bacterium]|nr:hypothetical protein [Longimicrobiales bacterium]